MLQDKKLLRVRMKKIRARLDIDAVSKELIVKIRNLEEYKNSQHVMIYYPLKDEVNLLPLMSDKEKTFYLPKICNKELLCCPYKDGFELSDSCFKTREPLTESVNKDILDLIFVPALACDPKNYRLGYGGGFYDRFLKNIKANTISCVPSALLIDSILPDIYDIPVKKVITA